eukprot:2102810-Prymnesium_polylepis.1
MRLADRAAPRPRAPWAWPRGRSRPPARGTALTHGRCQPFPDACDMLCSPNPSGRKPFGAPRERCVVWYRTRTRQDIATRMPWPMGPADVCVLRADGTRHADGAH